MTRFVSKRRKPGLPWVATALLRCAEGTATGFHWPTRWVQRGIIRTRKWDYDVCRNSPGRCTVPGCSVNTVYQNFDALRAHLLSFHKFNAKDSRPYLPTFPANTRMMLASKVSYTQRAQISSGLNKIRNLREKYDPSYKESDYDTDDEGDLTLNVA